MAANKVGDGKDSLNRRNLFRAALIPMAVGIASGIIFGAVFGSMYRSIIRPELDILSGIGDFM